MSEIVKKSIFIKSRQKVFPIFYIVEMQYLFNPKRNYYEREFSSYEPINEVDIFATVDIPTPLLAVGDEFYFEDKQQIVKINKVMRTSEDNVVYTIDTEIIYDEETKAKYEKDKQNYLDVKNYQEEIKRLKNRGLFARIRNK